MFTGRIHFGVLLLFFAGRAMAMGPLSQCGLISLGLIHSDDGRTRTQHYFTRQFETEFGPYHERLVVLEHDGPGRFKSYSVRRRVSRGLPQFIRPDGNGERVALPSHPNSEEIHYGLIKESADTNLAKYESRRNDKQNAKHGWPVSFIDKLKYNARATINQSIHHWAIDPKTGLPVSGIRVTMAPYGLFDNELVAEGIIVRSLFGPVSDFKRGDKTHDDNGLPRPLFELPDMEYLGINDPGRPAVFLNTGHPDIYVPYRESIAIPRRRVLEGAHIGIGGLYVEESLPQHERDLLNAHWMLDTVALAHGSGDPNYTYYGQKVLFMVDPLSERAYRPWKYEPLREYIRDGRIYHNRPGEKPHKITKDGIDWLPVEWTVQNQESYLARLEDGEVPGKTRVFVSYERQKTEDSHYGRDEIPFPFTAESMSGIDSILSRLQNGKPDQKLRAFDQLRHKLRLLQLHWDEHVRLKEDIQDGPLEAYEAGKKTVQRIERKIGELMISSDDDVRRYAFLLTGSLLEFGRRDPGFLPPEKIVQEYFPWFAVDKSPWIRNAVMSVIANNPPISHLYRKNRPLPEEAQVLKSLRSVGLDDEEISDLRKAIRTAMTDTGKPLVDALGKIPAHGRNAALDLVFLEERVQFPNR